MASSSNQAETFDSTIEIQSFSGGFNVLKSSHKVRNRIVVSKYLVCQKAGCHETGKIKESDSKSESSHASNTVGNQIRKRNTVNKKCDCNAKIILKYIGPDGPNKYVISTFVEGHNHLLASETGKEFLRVNRTMTAFQWHFLLDAAKSNIGALRAHSIYTSLFSLYSDVGPTAMDFQNWMRDIKLYIGKHDADMLLQKFKIKQDTSDGWFFYEYETDSNGHLTRLFWADVGPVFCAESGFMDKLNKFVWSSYLTVAEFEEGWNAVLKEFGLTDHVWLKDKYSMRKSWIPAF
ncbi:hypothetical protein AgCh_002224 [Apium graveolens]